MRRFVIIWNRFGYIHDLDAALPQTFLCDDSIDPVAGKAVSFPEDQISRTEFFNLVQHKLKGRTVVPGAAVCGVIVFFDDVIAVRLRIIMCGVFLLDNAHVPLRVGAIAVVADCVIAWILNKSCCRAHTVTSFWRDTVKIFCSRNERTGEVFPKEGRLAPLTTKKALERETVKAAAGEAKPMP